MDNKFGEIFEKRKVIKIILCIIFTIAVSVSAGLVLGGKAKVGSTVLTFFILASPLLLVYFGFKSLNNLIWINIYISGCLVLSLIFFLWSMPIGIFVTLPLFLYAVVMLFINLISLWMFWTEHDSKAFVPLLISILTIPAAIAAAKAGVYVDRWLDDYSFKKHLSEYEASIKTLEKKFEEGPFRLYLYKNEIPKELPLPAAQYIVGEKYDNNFSIRFCNRGGPDHAYFSGTDTELPENLSDWRKITAHWYRRY